MLPGDRASVAASGGFGAIAGWFIVGPGGAVLGAALGAGFAFMAARWRVRPLIATTSFVGAAAGALIGASIVETICLPDACATLELTGAVVVGLASLVGVGLMAALVTRSFDEYNESVVSGSPPPEPGCEQPDT
jgi:hypothetical protein